MTPAKIELFATVAAIVAVGVLVTLGLLSNEYGGIVMGILTGSGLRAAAANTIVAPKTVEVPTALPATDPKPPAL